MLIASYGINIEGSGGGERKEEMACLKPSKNTHTSSVENLPDAARACRPIKVLRDYITDKNKKQTKKSHRMKKKFLNTLKIRFIFFFSSVEQKNNSSTFQCELRLSRAPRLRSEFLLPASTQFTASPASQDVMLPSGAAL